MSIWQRESAVSQLCAHLRGELERGRWSEKMPGVMRLAEELGVARNTMEVALRELEREGLLVPQGHGKGRRIDLKGATSKGSGVRVAILLGEATERRLDYVIELRHELEQSGHSAFFVSETMNELGMDVGRIARVVEKTEADAWVLLAAAQEVLEWFLVQKVPAVALFGRRRQLRIAAVGPDKSPSYVAATWALLNLGHRHIVLMTRARRRLPKPGAPERAFLKALAAGGITPTSYHLPDWEETADGFNSRLEELFRLTPPTALILDEAPFFFAALRFCALRGLRVPGDVSLVCAEGDPGFDWCQPPVSHIRWESQPLVRRIVTWVWNVSHGKEDMKQTLTPAEFLPGGTISPVGRQ
jgi:DNA-binding LacI/PurR family transcriptional regulator